MDIEELTQKIDAKQLKEEAKKRGIKTACVKKIDIAVSLSRSLYKEAFSGSGSI